MNKYVDYLEKKAVTYLDMSDEDTAEYVKKRTGEKGKALRPDYNDVAPSSMKGEHNASRRLRTLGGAAVGVPFVGPVGMAALGYVGHRSGSRKDLQKSIQDRINENDQ